MIIERRDNEAHDRKYRRPANESLLVFHSGDRSEG